MKKVRLFFYVLPLTQPLAFLVWSVWSGCAVRHAMLKITQIFTMIGSHVRYVLPYDNVMVNVEVATRLINEEWEPLFAVAPSLLERSRPDAAWADRPRVSIEVEDRTSLQQILRGAGAAFGFGPKFGDPSKGGFSYLGMFYTGDGQAPKYVSTILDERGVITNHVDPMTVRYAQLAEAADVGVFDGDPHKIYLILNERQQWGGNGFAFWENLVNTLPDALVYLGSVYGGISAVKDTASGGLRVIRKVRQRWYSRRVRLSDIKRVVSRPRTTRGAAGLLGISIADAGDLLQALSLEPSDDGRWRSRTDLDAEMLRILMDSAEFAAELVLDRKTFRTCLEQVFSLPEADRLARIGEIFETAAEDSWSSWREDLDEDR